MYRGADFGSREMDCTLLRAESASESVSAAQSSPPCRRAREAELQRIASHLLWLGTHAMDIGAVTVLLYCFREREEILKIFEDFIGARLTAHAFRIGGLWWDAYPEFEARVRDFLKILPSRIAALSMPGKAASSTRIGASNVFQGCSSK